MGKNNQRTGHISEAISPTHFILGTKVQPNKAQSMTQVLMTLNFGKGQRSRSYVPKRGKKNQRTSHISEAISPTDFILGTKLNLLVKVKGQGHSFPKIGKTIKELVISLRLFHLQTLYLVPMSTHKCASNDLNAYDLDRPKVKVTGQGQIFPKMGKKLNNWPYLRCDFIYRLHTWYQGTTRKQGQGQSFPKMG